MRFVDSEESKKEYKKFLEENERCNFQQSLEWAEVKKPNWKPEVILAENEDGYMDSKNAYFWKYYVCIKRASM